MNYITETILIIKNYNNIKIAQNNLRDKIREIDTKLEGYTGITYGSIHSTTDNDKYLNLIFEKEVVTKAFEKNSITIKKIDKMLKGITREEKFILVNAYIDNKSDTQIAKDLNISRKTLNDKKRKAVKKLAIQLWGIAAL